MTAVIVTTKGGETVRIAVAGMPPEDIDSRSIAESHGFDPSNVEIDIER